MYREAIMAKGVGAMPDRLMAKALGSAVNAFGKEAVALAFRDRVLKIKFRQVEIDASDELDPEILGSSILNEVVRRYERPGFEYRYFTKICVDRFGWRGYTPVKDNGRHRFGRHADAGRNAQRESRSAPRASTGGSCGRRSRA